MGITEATGKAGGTRHHLRRALTVMMAVVAVAAGALAATPAAQAYGPYTCVYGLVWREATPGDYVCVTWARRELTWEENRLAASRVEPGGGAYGPDTCKQGFVWRETRPSDHVCVTPDIRDWAQQDNAKAVLGYAYIADIPANGTSSRWDVTYRQMWVSGSSFTPGGPVAAYGWATDSAYLVRQGYPLARGLADGGGWLTLAVTGTGCSLSTYRSMYILTVDEATGLVRNAGLQRIPCGLA